MEFQGKLEGRDTQTNSKLRIQLDANTADVQVGGEGRGGDIAIKDHNNSTKILLDAGGSEHPFAQPELFVPPTITHLEKMPLSKSVALPSQGRL
ncbi:MAG TPA: hypothetical protein VJP89_18225 [Pyrinomonadaceae bacterium]|nr:hypothetical protein [Pyrinomonadaceae bacterium]